jgi:SAM-dependent methyltransferase
MTHIIDWNEIWKLAHAIDTPSSDPWAPRAEHFENHVKSRSRETDEIIAKFHCKPTDTVLDIGAGTGRYAIPLSKQVASVTAIEPSAAMRNHLEKKQAAAQISNIVTLPLLWEDITIGKEIEPHDIVLAAHSCTMYDLKDALLKINRAAKREVWLILFAGNRMESWARDILMKARVNPDIKEKPFDYLIVYSMLHSLEIYADVTICTYAFSETYPDVETAVQDLRLMYNIPPENQVFTQEIQRRLNVTNNTYSLTRTSRIALIHWHVNRDSNQ